MAEPRHFDDSNFKQEVVDSDIPVLVDFWAPWCNPCRMLAPVIEKLADRYDGRLKVGKVNTDESPAASAQYDIHSIPTLLVFKAGKEVERLVGFMPEPALVERIESHLG